MLIHATAVSLLSTENNGQYCERNCRYICLHKWSPTLRTDGISKTPLLSVSSGHLSEVSQCPYMEHTDFTGNMCAQVWALQSSPESRRWSTLVLAWTWWNNLVNLHTCTKSSHTAGTLWWPNSEYWNPLWDLLYSEIFKSSKVLLLMIASHFNSFEKFCVLICSFGYSNFIISSQVSCVK